MKQWCVWSIVGALAATSIGAAQEAVGDSEYFPLKVGTVQTYSMPGAVLQVRVVRHEMFEGHLCARLETYAGTTMRGVEHVRVDLMGVARHGFNGNKIDPPMLLLVLPPKPDDSWTAKSKLMGQPIAGTFKTSKEQVTTAAGIFECIVVKSEDLTHGNRKMSTTNWYAPRVGLVKQSVKVGEVVTVVELTKFQSAPK